MLDLSFGHTFASLRNGRDAKVWVGLKGPPFLSAAQESGEVVRVGSGGWVGTRAGRNGIFTSAMRNPQFPQYAIRNPQSAIFQIEFFQQVENFYGDKIKTA